MTYEDHLEDHHDRQSPEEEHRGNRPEGIQGNHLAEAGHPHQRQDHRVQRAGHDQRAC